MSYPDINKLMLVFLLSSILGMGYASAQEEYSDNFNTLDSSRWTVLTSDTWQIINGAVSSTASRTGLIFEKWDGKKHISEVDFTANNTRIPDYALVGFYFYYEDSDNYGRVVFEDDNRKDKRDLLKIEQKGPSFTNTKTYINTSTNTSIEFDPNTFHHLKVVRLNKNIYVYYDNRLALTTEFKDENPAGKVGFDVYACTGYFDNFYLRPITMENASDYINELNLTSTYPTTRIGSIYTLRLDGISDGEALFCLSKSGKLIDSSIASEGSTVSLNFDNGKEGLNFKVTQLFDAENNSAVWLEDIILASTDELDLTIDNISMSSSYHQEEDMDICFSVTNQGGITYSGKPEIIITAEDYNKIVNPELDLTSGESENFTAMLIAPMKLGTHTITISVSTEYTIIERSVYYQVRALNPTVTTLSANLREDNGIKGTVGLESPFPSDLVDWNMTALVTVYAIVENGKRELYSKEVPVTSRIFDISIPYDEFYQGDGQYLVVVKASEMQDNEFMEIVGQDFIYAHGRKVLPPTIVSNDIYLHIIMLLLGMFAALSVRNHMQPASRSLPLDLVLVVCGGVVLAAALVRVQSDMAAVGIVMLGIGAGAVMAKKGDSAVGTMLRKDSHLHDFTGMMLVFLSAGYIVTHIPQWSFMVIIVTLVGYYTALNLYRGSSG
jgi:hypothetical protein